MLRVLRSPVPPCGTLAFLVLTILALPACSGPFAGMSVGGEDEEEAAAPVERTIQGYQVQIYTTSNKGEADRVVEQALAWWRDVPDANRPDGMGAEIDVDVVWQQPYYRVRLGRFAGRNRAAAVLDLARQRFRDAFIVPTEVTVRE